MILKTAITGAALAVGMIFGFASANAAPVLGSHVDSSTFTSAIGSTSGWSYLGDSAAAFTAPGQGEIELRSSNFANSFGYAHTNHTGATEIFSSGASVGTTAMIDGYSSYIFFFNASAPINIIDGSTQWTDGTLGNGGFIGFAQGGIDIFQNAASQTWAFFFDDGGPSGFGDDNDYNDMVVTFSQAGVPEPATLSLFGLGLIGAGILRRRKQQAA